MLHYAFDFDVESYVVHLYFLSLEKATEYRL